MWGKNWTYAHNGQLSGYKEALPIKFHLPIGTTDSEHAFCWLLDQLHIRFAQQEPNEQVLFAYIAELSKKIDILGVCNLIVSNGECLFAYCSNNLHWITRCAPFGKASLIDAEVMVDFKEETTANDIVSIIATKPLTDDETWHKMSAGQWQLFCLGKSIASGC
jgi:glutamine amidotransferase